VLHQSNALIDLIGIRDGSIALDMQSMHALTVTRATLTGMFMEGSRREAGALALDKLLSHSSKTWRDKGEIALYDLLSYLMRAQAGEAPFLR